MYIIIRLYLCSNEITVNKFQATEWLADYYTPGGVDKDAWQYATDFPASYHGKSGFTDYVRRRRWARKAKVLKHFYQRFNHKTDSYNILISFIDKCE